MIARREPRYQDKLAFALLGALAVVVSGTLIGSHLGVHGVLTDAASNWYGLQRFEYLDLARLWQVLLAVGLVVWVFMSWRVPRRRLAGEHPARRHPREGRAHREIITRDNVPARVAAVCCFRVVHPSAAVTEVEAFAPATSQIAQTTLRSVLGGARPRPAARRARAPQRAPRADRRRADRAVGRRDQGRRDPRGQAARDGTPGRRRARAPREDHQRGGRVPGGREARRGRCGHRSPAVGAAAALPVRRCSRSAPTRARRSSSRCRWTSSRRSSPAPRPSRTGAVDRAVR